MSLNINESQTEILTYAKCIECKAPILDVEDEYCESCVIKLINSEQSRITQLEKNMDDIQGKIEKLENDISKIDDTIQRGEGLEKMLEKQKQMEIEIFDLEKKEVEQNDKLKSLKNDILVLEKNEENLWVQINQFLRKLYQLLESSQIADNTLEQLNGELERLNKIDILNDIFRISVQDDVAILNNIIIGKKNDQPIEWEEMNSAMCHLCILIIYLMKKYHYIMSEYYRIFINIYRIERIDLEGCQTKITNKKNKVILLYMMNKTPTIRDEEEFNEAFLLLFKELSLFCKHLEDTDILRKRNIKLNLPFKFNGYLIADKSMNLKDYNNLKWESWTEAVKRLFANIKSIIAMNSQFDKTILEEEFVAQQKLQN